MPTEVGGGMELLGNLVGFLFVLQKPYLENGIFLGRGIDGQAAESINVRLGFPGAMLHGEVMLLQCGQPAVEKSGSRSHRFEPLHSVVVGVDFKWHLHQIRSELCEGPNNGETFQLGGGIGFFRLVEGAQCAADDALLAFPDLSEGCAETCGRLVRI